MHLSLSVSGAQIERASRLPLLAYRDGNFSQSVRVRWLAREWNCFNYIVTSKRPFSPLGLFLRATAVRTCARAPRALSVCMTLEFFCPKSIVRRRWSFGLRFWRTRLICCEEGFPAFFLFRVGTRCISRRAALSRADVNFLICLPR